MELKYKNIAAIVNEFFNKEKAIPVAVPLGGSMTTRKSRAKSKNLTKKKPQTTKASEPKPLVYLI